MIDDFDLSLYWDPWFDGLSLYDLVPNINSYGNSISVKVVIIGGRWSLPICLQNLNFF